VNGDLIGINTRILSRSGGSNGIGFAIPANLVREFVKQARAGSEGFQRPWAGMAGQPVDADLAASLGMDLPEGMVISELHPQSPFAKAGFEVGDVITDVDGQVVNSPSEMVFRMSVAGLDGTSMVTRLRGDRRETLVVEMFTAPNDPPARSVVMNENSVLPGLTVGLINPVAIVRLQLPLSATGVAVLDPGPYAARAGIKAGDILLAINGKEVTSSEDVPALLEQAGRRLRFDLNRRGQRVSLHMRR
jgi:S1-C subfamily serine protease